MIGTLGDFVERMGELGIEYMVTGSYAMSAYGEIRMTRDIDVLIRVSERDATRLAEKFAGDYYINETTVRRAIERGSMFNIISHQHGGKIDCIVMKDDEFERTSLQQRFKANVDGVEFWCTTKENLIIAKLNWAKDTFSEMQIRDIANLTSGEYNAEYVAGWIGRLGLEEIWQKVAEWKTRRKMQEN